MKGQHHEFHLKTSNIGVNTVDADMWQHKTSFSTVK
jgi:hypothetical protein